MICFNNNATLITNFDKFASCGFLFSLLLRRCRNYLSFDAERSFVSIVFFTRLVTGNELSKILDSSPIPTKLPIVLHFGLLAIKISLKINGFSSEALALDFKFIVHIFDIKHIGFSVETQPAMGFLLSVWNDFSDRL